MVRDKNGRFVPGHPPAGDMSGAGRKKGLQARCQAVTHDGLDVVQFMLDVLQGKVEEAKTSDRIEAAKWFADRGWGKAVQQVDAVQSGKMVIEVVRVAGTRKAEA